MLDAGVVAWLWKKRLPHLPFACRGLPAAIFGGQRRRVALARLLVVKPRYGSWTSLDRPHAAPRD